MVTIQPAFDLPEDWVWDFWMVDDGAVYHLFFLHAPRSLGDPDLRHENASVGHAVSTDLTDWTRLPDAVVPGEKPAFDDLATWTGSVARGDDGMWRMFYTGISRAEGGRVQRIGLATSSDLLSWRKDPDWLLTADDRWYDTATDDTTIEHWRDPWLCRDTDGTWHMYVTASAGDGDGPGVMGHAESRDMVTWEVRAPLSAATGRFDWLEVIQVLEVDGRWVALFSCLSAEMPRDGPGSGGVWSVAVDGPGAPVDVSRAVRLTSEDLYVGKVVPLRDGGQCFLAFENRGPDGLFRGGVIAPLSVRWNAAGSALELSDAPTRWKG